MKKNTIVSIVHGKKEVIATKDNPGHIITTDLESITYCRTHNLTFSPLFSFFTPSSLRFLDPKLPLIIATQFLSHPKIKSQLQIGNLDLTIPLTEMLRFELVNILSKYYYLAKLHQKLGFKKLTASNFFFPKLVLDCFQRQTRIKINLINHNQSLLDRLIFRVKEQIGIYRFLLRHPFSLIPARPLANNRSEVLLFSNGMNMASYYSAIRKLCEKTSVKLVSGPQTSIDKIYLHKYHLSPAPINFSHESIQSIYHELSVELQKIHKHFHLPPSVRFAQKFSRPTLLSSPNLTQLLFDITQQALRSWLDKFLRYFAAADVLIRQNSPKLVITTHDPGPTGVAFTLAAKAHHIKSVVLLHGAPSQVHFFFADKEIIWGKLMKQQLINNDLPPNKLILGCHPIYYAYKRYFETHGSKRSQTLKIGVITSGIGSTELHQTAFFYDLLPEVKKISQPFILTVRSHQTQKFKDLQTYANYLNLPLHLNLPQLLEEFVEEQDIIIAQDSTAALVPLIAAKPTILSPLTYPFVDNALFIHTHAFIHCPNFKQLPKIIKRIQKSPQTWRLNQQIFLNQFCGNIDKNTGPKIAQQLKSLIPIA